MTLFILHLVFYYLFMYFDDERREWMVIVVCEKRETIKKIDISMKYNIK